MNAINRIAPPSIDLSIPKPTRRERTRRGFVIGRGVAILLIILWALNLFESANLRLTNIYFVGNEQSQQIVIVALDDASLQAYGRSPMEWDRRLYADLMDILAAGGARVVAFDLLFSEPSLDDTLFADAIRNARESDARTRVVLPIAGVGGVRGDALSRNLQFDALLRPVTPLDSTAEYLAAVNTIPDTDGMLRRQSTMIQVGNTPHLSFTLATYLGYLRIPSAAAWQVVIREGDTLNITPERQVIVDQRGLWLQNFFGTTNQSFPIYSMQAVLTGEIAPEVFSDKIVLVGLINAQGATDTYFVPSGVGGAQMAGVEVQAHAIETLLRGHVLREQNNLEQVLAILFTAIGVSLIFAQVRWYAKLFLAVGFILLLIIIGSIYFSLYGIIVYLFYPIFAIALPALIEIGTEINSEVTTRHQTEFTLAKVAALYTETQRQKQLLEATLKNSPAGIVIVDGAARFVQANDVFHRLLLKPEDKDTPSTVEPGKSPTPIRLGASLEDTTLFEALQQAGVDSESLTRLQRRFALRQAFQQELKLGAMTFNLYASLLEGYDLWVMVFSDVTALAELSHLKTQMIRMASHDLKNPLGTVTGYVSLMMMDEDLIADEHKRYLGIIERASETMLNIIQDILNLEQLRSTQMPNERVPLAQLAYDVIGRHEPEMTAKQQTFSFKIQPNLPMMIGRPTQLAQVVSNLLSNAIKYTPSEGNITLNLYQADPYNIRLEVQDTGYGISQEAQKKLFTEFYRVRTKETANIPGTGLGLSLIKSVVEAHHGRIWVESEQNQGSTFFVEFPIETNEQLQMITTEE